MKEAITNLLNIFEQSKGVQNLVEDEFKKYCETNKQTLKDEQEQFLTQMNEMMEDEHPDDLDAAAEKVFDVLENMVGEKKLAEMLNIFEAHSFVKDLFEEALPDSDAFYLL